MRQKLIVILFVCGLLWSGIPHESYAGDWELWNAMRVKTWLSEKTILQLEKEFRADENGFYYYHTDAQFSQNIFSWLGAGINYRHIFTKGDDDWYQEKRPHLNILVKKKIRNNILLTNRNRLALRLRDNHKNKIRYRNRASIVLPELFNIGNPYIADEVFFSFDDGFIRNRLYAGLQSHISSFTAIETFYLLQTSRSHAWEQKNVIGIKIKISW